MSLSKTFLSFIKPILDNHLQFAKRVYDLYVPKDRTSLKTTINSLRNKLVQFLTEAYVLHSEEDTLIFCYGIKPWLSERSIWEIPEDGTWSKSAPWCANGIKKVVFDPSFKDFQPHSMRGWFAGLTELTTIEGLENLDYSRVTNMKSMFSGCSSLTALDVSKFDTSKVTSLSDMFSGCSSLTTLDVSNFDTSKVGSMSKMFSGCSSLTTLDVSKFDTSQVTNMESLFSGCSSLTTLDVSNFKTSKVTNMKSMFSGCSALTTLDVSNFYTYNVTNMKSMFSDCSALSRLKCKLHISRGTNISNMLSGTRYKNSIALSQLFNE